MSNPWNTKPTKADIKKSNELFAHAYAKLYNIPSTGLRFFTVYGPAGRPDMAYFGFTNKLRKGETIQIFNYGGPSNYEEAQDIFVSNIIKSRFVHFQITKKSDGGFDAFAVFRIPESSRAVIIRLCK